MHINAVFNAFNQFETHYNFSLSLYDEFKQAGLPLWPIKHCANYILKYLTEHPALNDRNVMKKKSQCPPRVSVFFLKNIYSPTIC